MSIRYIFNTSGNYVAFVYGQHIFTPDSEWIGFIPEANIVFNTDGTYMGEISPDDRVIKNKNARYTRLSRPMRPMKPMRPMRPLKRLRMSRLPHPYEDVFEDTSASPPKATIKDFSYLFGSEIIACDPQNTFLGSITNSRFDQNSIINIYSPYGSKYSQTCIFNQYCPFGGQYGQYSPLNQYSQNPPKIIKNGQFVAWLSINQYLSGKRVDAKEFFKWLSSLN